MQKFSYKNGMNFTAKDQVDGILIDPILPRNFDNIPNEDRPSSHNKWQNFPFIVTETLGENDAMYADRTDEYAAAGREHWAKARISWMESWPSGTRFETRCLDGGAWDRSTSWGTFPTLEMAVRCAKTGPRWRCKQ